MGKILKRISHWNAQGQRRRICYFCYEAIAIKSSYNQVYSFWPPAFSRKEVLWSHDCQSVSQSVSRSVSNYFFLKKWLIIFSWNCMWSCGVIKVDSDRTKSYFQKTARKYSQNRVFWSWRKNWSTDVCFFWVYIMHHSCLYDSAKAVCFGKI